MTLDTIDLSSAKELQKEGSLPRSEFLPPKMTVAPRILRLLEKHTVSDEDMDLYMDAQTEILLGQQKKKVLSIVIS